MISTERLNTLLRTIDDCNLQDPNTEILDGQPVAKEWLYGQRMTATLASFEPDAGEELQIAARAQHIERWHIPRRDYPLDRAGYLTWRRDLGRFHAERTTHLMATLGYDRASQDAVTRLLTKRGIKQNQQAQTLEDVICLVFVQFYLADFAANQESGKLHNIIRKTWAKMSTRGQQKVLTLPLDPALKTTLETALAV
jgi:hypothetical protein